MDKRYFIELTNRLYRLTFFFPQREPLRHKIREVADEILSNLTIILEGDIRERRESAFVVEGDIEILLTLLELAKAQNWTEAREIDKIQEDYDLIKREVEDFNEFTRKKQKLEQLPSSSGMKEERGEKGEERSPSPSPEKRPSPAREKTSPKKEKLNKRQEKVLKILEKREKIQVQDVQDEIPGTIKRTVRRDLGDLVNKGILKRVGSGKMTYYARIGQQ